MGGLFGAIPTESHAAPTASLSASPVKEEKRAWRSLTRFYPSQILRGEKIRHRVGNWQKQRIGLPPPQSTSLKSGRRRLAGRIDRPRYYSPVRIVAFEYSVQGLKFA
jgi:hypothetical protein